MPILIAIAGAILVAFGLFLIGVAVVVFARPALAERFFMAFASSARTHYTEQLVRLLVGVSLIIRSAAMWQPKVFWFVGWAITLTSLLLIVTPWQWHHRFGEKVRPMLIRRMKVYAVGLLAFGVLIIFAVFAGVSPNASRLSNYRIPAQTIQSGIIYPYTTSIQTRTRYDELPARFLERRVLMIRKAPGWLPSWPVTFQPGRHALQPRRGHSLRIILDVSRSATSVPKHNEPLPAWTVPASLAAL